MTRARLLIYRLAVGAAVSNAFSLRDVAPAFALAVAGSLVAGPALGWLFMSLTRNVRDVPTAIILQFIGTFGVWILADRIGLSGVLTMVCYAVFVARSAPERTPARIRLPSYAVWETVVFVLNVLAFVFIGLQIRPILTGLDPAARARYLYVAGAVLVTVIVVRVAWVMTQNAIFRWKIRKYGFHPPRPTLRPSVRSGLIISWSGMRGIVSLAAALALPTAATGAAFPFRDLIVITAFSVVLGTLVIQGLTLRPLIEALDLHDDDPVGREVDAARNRALRAALATCADDMSPAAEAVRQEFAAHLKPATSVEAEGSSRESDHEAVHQRAIAAARQVDPRDAVNGRHRRRRLPSARRGARLARDGERRPGKSGRPVRFLTDNSVDPMVCPGADFLRWPAKIPDFSGRQLSNFPTKTDRPLPPAMEEFVLGCVATSCSSSSSGCWSGRTDRT